MTDIAARVRLPAVPFAAPSTIAEAREHLRRRFSFTSAVGRALVNGLSTGTDGSIVYGVWLHGLEPPIYIGQSTEANRRLWDLPIGESHHLSNTFPPEMWSRIVVVQWSGVLADSPGFPPD